MRHELRIRPESSPPLCHADHWFYGSDGRLLALLEDVVGVGTQTLNRLAGARRDAASTGPPRASRSSAWRACSRAPPTSTPTGGTSSASVDATSEPPPEAWDPDVYYDPEFADEDRTYCKRGGYLGALARFDPLAHGIPPVAVGGEPDQWLALQVARDALADAAQERAARGGPRRAPRSCSARAPT